MKIKKLSLVKKISVVGCFCLSILILSLWQYNSGVSAKPQDTYRNLEVFSNVLNIVQKNYVEDVDVQELIQGAIKGMLSSLDPHSTYMKPDDFKELKVETKGSFTGIGIEITMKDGILTVVSPIEGTPAFKKGLRAGDKIIKIKKESTSDLTLMQAVKKLRGPKGTSVTISIHRKGWTNLKRVTIVRDVIPLQSVKSKFLDPGYGYIRVINFQSKTTRDFIKALKDLKAEETIKGLIIDLRNNPGGLLDQAVKVADIFLEDGVIVSTKGRIKDQNMIFKAHKNGDRHDFPMVVLVNEGSASASEIVAGALQDQKKAIVMGAKTFGKGSVQTVIPMSNGAGLRLTTARYYTPNGISIQAKGITPDILVATEVFKKDSNGKLKKMKFLREKDLKRHIKNGEEPEEENLDEDDGAEAVEDLLEEDPSEEDTSLMDDDEDEDTDEDFDKDDKDKEKEKKEAIRKDKQLFEALTLLKGLNVFEELYSKKQ